MKPRWQKLGRILTIQKNIDWLYAWAGASCALPIEGRPGLINLYVTGRDKEKRSRIGLVKFDLANLKVLTIKKPPILPLGEKGAFDENGTSYPYVLKKGQQYYLYYTGWVQGVQVPWYNGLGLAISPDGVSFKKYSRAPIFHRTSQDFIGIGSSCIRYENHVFKIWYSRFEKWVQNKKDFKHYYNIKYGESKNGIDWQSFNKISIDFKNKGEYAIAKPTVIKIGRRYHMWYSYRGISYRIGYAVSDNGINWQRKDHLVGIDVSKKGWDSEMICYAFVFKHKDYLYMLYNGNDYGKSGLGLARLKLENLNKL